eukprot:14769220-Heterocapsa_arctica.AAC.1
MPVSKMQRRQRKRVQLPVSRLPFGESYFDFLPEAVVEKIFKDKDSIEFQHTLDTIKKFRYAMCKDDLWFARQPIRELLRPI